jgi:hypothetical protein
MFPATPALRRWLPAFVLLIALQAFNSLARWGIPIRTLIGVGFYLAPLMGIWVGFQLGRFQGFLRRLLQLYLFGTALFGFTALLDYLGTQTPLFDAVGIGLVIHFGYGFSTTGAIGLWRSTDMAAIHLAAGACLALVFTFSSASSLQRAAWLMLSGLFAFTSLLTGRRKAIVQVVVFVGLYFTLLARYGSTRSHQQIYGVAISAVGMAAMVFLLDPYEFLGDDLGHYVDRAATAPSDLWGRFNLLGLNAFLRGLEISNGIGLGVGTLAQTGAAGVAAASGASFEYVAESGLGKVAAELGVPGLLLLLQLGAGLFRAVLHAMRLMRYLPLSISVFEIGLMAFALSNLPFFSAAAGVYGDPFVLILIGICFGSVFAVPTLLAQRLRQLHSAAPYILPAVGATADG